MMKHLFKFTHIVAVAFAAVCMFGFSACNDEPYQHADEKAATLEKEITEMTDELQTQIDDLKKQVNDLAAKTCMCEIKTAADVAKIINDSLKNYWNITEVQNFVNTKLNDYVLVTTFNQTVDQLNQDITNLTTTVNGHTNDIAQLYTDVANLNTAVGNAQAKANAAYDLAVRDSVRIDTLVTNIYNTVNNLAGRVTNLEGQITAVIDSAAKANALARIDSMRIDALEQTYAQLHETDSVQQVQIDSIIAVIDNLATKAEVLEVKQRADSLFDRAVFISDSLHILVMDTLGKLDARITTLDSVMNIVRSHVDLLDGKVDSLANEIDALKTQVLKNTQDIDKLTKKVDDVFAKTIFGVVVQGTYNPVFGYFALPAGVQSNVLIAYYGENPEHPIVFPSTATSDLVYDYPLTVDDELMLNLGSFNPLPIGAQETLLGDGANAGKLFITVNPNSADLTDATFTLENSISEEAGIKLDSLKPSTEKLTFGYTGPINRAAAVSGHAANGFYEASAMLDEAGIPTAKIQLDPELKQAFKDFYNNHFKGKSTREAASSLADPSSFAQLAYGLYQQFNGLMPRYAVKAHWTDSLGDHDVYSGYDVAAVAVKPLSYAFFSGREDKFQKLKLPNITPISELTGFHIDMKDIHFNISFNIGASAANIHLSAIQIDLENNVLITLSVPDLAAYQANPGAPIQYNDETVDLTDLQDYLNSWFQSTIDNWSDNINNEIDQQVNSLINEINLQVNNFATNIEGQLNTQIQQVVDDAQQQVMNKFSGYISKLNKVIGKINAAINRVNHLLDNPSKLLQTVLIYEGADRQFHLMSTTKTIPTVFRGSGAIMLYPTSYNAEIAAPAYKKFIAVTNVFKGSTSAQGGDSDCQNILRDANNQGDFNKVLEGGRYGVAFVPSDEKGYTYEIFYSAIDYSGKISQRKYYVTVK